MILLDTDHLSVLTYPGGAGYVHLTARMQAAGIQTFATTVVCVEEQLRGWLAFIHRLRDIRKQIPAYARLGRVFDFLRDWRIVPFDDPAADEFQRLRKQRIQIGTQDLKIASIALVQNALLLSANMRHFRRISGLHVENWLT